MNSLFKKEKGDKAKRIRGIKIYNEKKLKMLQFIKGISKKKVE